MPETVDITLDTCEMQEFLRARMIAATAVEGVRLAEVARTIGEMGALAKDMCQLCRRLGVCTTQRIIDDEIETASYPPIEEVEPGTPAIEPHGEIVGLGVDKFSDLADTPTIDDQVSVDATQPETVKPSQQIEPELTNITDTPPITITDSKDGKPKYQKERKAAILRYLEEHVAPGEPFKAAAMHAVLKDFDPAASDAAIKQSWSVIARELIAQRTLKKDGQRGFTIYRLVKQENTTHSIVTSQENPSAQPTIDSAAHTQEQEIGLNELTDWGLSVDRWPETKEDGKMSWKNPEFYTLGKRMSLNTHQRNAMQLLVCMGDAPITRANFYNYMKLMNPHSSDTRCRSAIRELNEMLQRLTSSLARDFVVTERDNDGKAISYRLLGAKQPPQEIIYFLEQLHGN